MLKLHFPNASRAPVWVVEKQFSIGTRADNHLVLDDPALDPIHARLVQEGGKYYLRDNNSRQGCFVNGQRITSKEVVAGDRITLGAQQFTVRDAATDTAGEDQALQWQLIAESGLLANRAWAIPAGRPVVIGRDPGCDIVIPGNYLSRRNTRLEVRDDRVEIVDLGSANGTFLNEQPVREATARPGDRLRLDIYTFRLAAPDPEAIRKARLRESMRLLAKPVERKQADPAPRHWKTRPTSPGNRIEPETRKARLPWIGGLLLLGAVLAAALVIFL